MKKLLLLSALFWATCANATLVDVNADYTGWYNDLGIHPESNYSYFVGDAGYYDGNMHSFRDFFIFDLGDLNASVTSAKLELYTWHIGSSGTFQMFDVATAASTLRVGGTDLTSVYDDLGTGASFGFADLLTSQSNQLLQIDLNANAIAAINAASGKFAIGGSFLAQSQNEAFAFGLVDNFASVKLILDTVPTSVPQPNSLALFIIGLAGLGYFRRKNAV